MSVINFSKNLKEDDTWIDNHNVEEGVRAIRALLLRVQKISNKLPLWCGKPQAYFFDVNRTVGITKDGLFAVKIPKNKGAFKGEKKVLLYWGMFWAFYEDMGEWFTYHSRYLDYSKLEHRFHYYLLIHEPEAMPTLHDILYCNNQETRRILIEKYGWSELLKDTNAKLIDQEGDSCLWHIHVDNPINIQVHRPNRIIFNRVISRSFRVVSVKDASTNRRYMLQVPPRFNTCRSAIAWTFNLDEVDYKPLQET
jgi:hypothetical protein